LATSARLWLCAALLAPADFAAAQDTGTVHSAPYLPSPPSTVDEMLRLAAVGPGDIVYDLGAGDGRVVIAAAAKFGARGVGVERDARLVAQARQHAARAGVADPDFKSAMDKLETPIAFRQGEEFQRFFDADARRLAEGVRKVGKIESK